MTIQENSILHADEIAKSWISKAQKKTESPDAITRFIFLWFAFNAYYSEYYIELCNQYKAKSKKNRIGLKSPSEINAICESVSHLSHILNEFEETSGFAYLKKRPITNLTKACLSHGYGEDEEHYGNIYSEDISQRLKGYMNILYSIRCNLFHGHKHCYDSSDQEVLENASYCLVIILKELYN